MIRLDVVMDPFDLNVGMRIVHIIRFMGVTQNYCLLTIHFPVAVIDST